MSEQGKSGQAEGEQQKGLDPQQVIGLMEGAIDIHVHADPDPYAEREMDARELVVMAKVLKMGGLVLKSHEYPTQPLAWALAEEAAPVRVFGGIALDHGVGGLNPEALRISLRLGARVVWMPTFDAAHWRELHPGRWNSEAEPIRILDDEGRLDPVCETLLDLIAEHDAALASGHLSVEETLPLLRSAKERGIRTVITHASFWWPVEAQREAAELGAMLEQCMVATAGEDWKTPTAEIVEQVRQVGPEHVVLATDLGQKGNLPPPMGLVVWVDRFLRAGFSEDEVSRMVRENPARLLGV